MAKPRVTIVAKCRLTNDPVQNSIQILARDERVWFLTCGMMARGFLLGCEKMPISQRVKQLSLANLHIDSQRGALVVTSRGGDIDILRDASIPPAPEWPSKLLKWKERVDEGLLALGPKRAKGRKDDHWLEMGGVSDEGSDRDSEDERVFAEYAAALPAELKKHLAKVLG